VLKKLFENRSSETHFFSLSFVASLLFCAHPIHTEVVANIKGRDEILSLIFSLMSLSFTLDYLRNNKIYLLILSGLSFFLGLLSKENVFTFVAVIPLAVYFFRKANAKQYLIILLPVIVAVVFYFLLRLQVLGSRIQDVSSDELLNNPFLGMTAVEKFATLLFTWLKYLVLLIFPHPLTHDYYPKQIQTFTFNSVLVWLSIAIIILLVYFAVKGLKNRKIYAFAILFFYITFSMVSNLVFNIGTFMNERFVFMSSVGFVIFIAWLLTEMPVKQSVPKINPKFLTVFLFMILSLYSIKTVTRNRDWYDDFTLFTHDVEISVNSAKCNTSAGGKLLEKADSTKNEAEKQQYIFKAKKYLKRGLEIYPENFQTLNLMGNAFVKQNRYDSAFYYYNKCFCLRPKNSVIIQNLWYLGEVTNKANEYKIAEKSYTLLLESKKNSPDFNYGLGVAKLGLNSVDSAKRLIQKAISLKPDYGDAYSKLGEIYGKYLMKLDSAEYFFNKALKINPGDASSLENLGIVYGIKKDYVKSLDFFKKALELNPDKAEIYYNLAGTYHSLGDTKSEQECLSKWKDLKNTQ
jgi:tetratricopeptide (TPR) repeat protein